MTTSTTNPPTLRTIPIPLSRLLSCARNVNGVPPDVIQHSGVACLNGSDMLRLGANVLDLLLLQTLSSNSITSHGPTKIKKRTRAVIAQAWPLYAVDEGFVALDMTTLTSLGLDATNLSLDMMTSLLSPHRMQQQNNGNNSTPKRGRKKKRPSAQLQNHVSPGGRMTMTPSPHRNDSRSRRIEKTIHSDNNDEDSVKISIHLIRRDEIEIGRNVYLKMLGSHPKFPHSEPFEDALCTRMHGRAVTVGMHVHTSVLGAAVEFEVIGFEDNIHATDTVAVVNMVRLIDNTSQIFITQQDDNDENACDELKRIRNQIPLLERLGGIDNQLSILQPLLRTALSLSHDANNSNNSSNINNTCSSTANLLRTAAVARGVLIHGPSGCGKTALALGVAQCCKNTHIEFIACTSLITHDDRTHSSTTVASTTTTTKLARAFASAARKAPSIIILDDIDAIAQRRDSPNTDATVVAQLLKLLDNMHSDCMFVVGTTSRIESLDAAVRRPGRLDVEVEITVPTHVERADMFHALIRYAKQINSNSKNTKIDIDINNKDIEEAVMLGHGHVAADVMASWRAAIGHAISRKTTTDPSSQAMTVTKDDLFRGVRQTRPTALREVWVEVPTTKWSDVGGKDDAKALLREAIEWPTSHEAVLSRLGISPPCGILLFGPPGCSKTLLARAVATECHANFISIKGAELLSKYVGDSEKAVRSTFERARAAAPCVVFFDEVDALASSRVSSSGSSTGVHARVVAQLLHEMDGIDYSSKYNKKKRVVVIAATNRPDVLDPAFLRAGRIDVQIYVGMPDSRERLEILKVHTKNMPLASDVQLETIASDRKTDRLSGAELAAVVREAGLAAMERDVEHVDSVQSCDFDVALSKVKPRTTDEMMAYFQRYVQQLERRKAL